MKVNAKLDQDELKAITDLVAPFCSQCDKGPSQNECATEMGWTLEHRDCKRNQYAWNNRPIRGRTALQAHIALMDWQ